MGPRIAQRYSKEIGRLGTKSTRMNQVAIEFIKLHVFCDACINGTCSVVYAVIYQEGTEFQGSIASKARLSRRGLTIPRLELLGAHMAKNFG